jgi:hypothetical protein
VLFARDASEVVNELPTHRARFERLRARLKARQKALNERWDKRDEVEAKRDEAIAREFEAPSPPPQRGKGRKKKAHKGKSRGKRKGRRRQGQAEQEAGAAGAEGDDEGEEEPTLTKPPAVVGADAGAEDEWEEPEECAICLVAMDEGEGLRGPSCGHMFHEGCLAAWSGFCAGKERKMTCPMCRCSAL